MQNEAIGFLNGIGINASQIITDGRIHRVNRGKKGGKSAWYIAWEKPLPVVVAGDWRTGEKWNWCGKTSLTPSEQKRIRRQLTHAINQTRAAALANNVAARERAQAELAEASPGAHPYLASKGLLARYGTHVDGDRLLVPMQDYCGVVWGLQSIDHEGKKLFLSGQRVKGCFHAIDLEKTSKTVLVCEGYATACTLHMALELPVVAAFSASNLGPAAAAVTLHAPFARIVICADNDHRTQGNPGLSAGFEAMRVLRTEITFPEKIFGTDFNDLALERGLAAVRAAYDSRISDPACEYTREFGFKRDKWMEDARWGK